MAGRILELTNEEKRVDIYHGAGEPTIPDSVTPETNLNELNLNWKEKDLPERIRTKHVHRLHPYLGKFIPQLAEIFLRKYFETGMTVLDPFAGSGTALVQANELGINSLEYDISAFNVMLIHAKTKEYDLKTVKKEINDILQKVEKLSSSQLTLFETDNSNEYINEWFAPQARRELLTYRELINSYENKDILKIILSRSARSARLTTHFDLDFPKKPQMEPYWCYKHRRICTPIKTAY